MIPPRSVQSSRTARVPLSEEQAAPHDNRNEVVADEFVVSEGHTTLQKRGRRTLRVELESFKRVLEIIFL